MEYGVIDGFLNGCLAGINDGLKVGEQGGCLDGLVNGALDGLSAGCFVGVETIGCFVGR